MSEVCRALCSHVRIKRLSGVGPSTKKYENKSYNMLLNRRIQLCGVLAKRLLKLVNLRTARKLISDTRTATYVILSTGSGPGGRWFKSIRPDHFF